MNVIQEWWEYQKAEMRGTKTATAGLLTFIKDVSNFSPMAMMFKSSSSAWEAWKNTDDTPYLEAFNQSFTDKQFADLADIIGVDPRTITKEDIADALAIASFVWDDADTQALLVSFAVDYISAQHSLEAAEFGSQVVAELAFDILITALTAGAGAAIALGGKIRHIKKLGNLGKLFKSLARLKRRRMSAKKASGNTGGSVNASLGKAEAYEAKVTPANGAGAKRKKPEDFTEHKSINHKKAAAGEYNAHQVMTENDYKALGKTDGVYKPGASGIDGVYAHPNPPPDYVITEAKYNTAQFGKTNSGKQMSNEWITDKRLEKAGLTKRQRDEILDALEENDDAVQKLIVRTKPDGTIVIKQLDENGNIIGKAIDLSGG